MLLVGLHPKFDLLHFSNNSRQNGLLEVSVKWTSGNVNMFAIYYLSRIRHIDSYTAYWFIAASCLL